MSETDTQPQNQPSCHRCKKNKPENEFYRLHTGDLHKCCMECSDYIKFHQKRKRDEAKATKAAQETTRAFVKAQRQQKRRKKGGEVESVFAKSSDSDTTITRPPSTVVPTSAVRSLPQPRTITVLGYSVPATRPEPEILIKKQRGKPSAKDRIKSAGEKTGEQLYPVEILPKSRSGPLQYAEIIRRW
ncbi:hypothetical protein BT63DRAFT_450113 [Microthyrium microscopicum]|uniref:Uncharacterized protein n=1 Tax=Microthyrium microscopicum TaxID=703497 RepID=A0A6A6UUI7_9PEZI|nr:hypothetical protein BT63DRAFT_450113 [Microthyrium microscopicum]